MCRYVSLLTQFISGNLGLIGEQPPHLIEHEDPPGLREKVMSTNSLGT